MLQAGLLKNCRSSSEADMIEEELNSFKRILLIEYQGSLINTAQFGIKNHYNQKLILPTISHEFIVRLDNRSLNLSLFSDILYSANKQFCLTHYYHWNCDTIKLKFLNHLIDNSHLGPWNLETNIPGIKRIITKPVVDEISRDCDIGVDRLCQNLKVDYKLLPEYLQEEVDKVKSLKK